MDFGICAIAYNGYGKYARQFLENIKKMYTRPRQVTIVLGLNHGCKDNLEGIIDNLTIIYDDSDPNMGRLRNIAIQNTTTEWIQYISIDDKIERDAINIFSNYKDADYICSSWARIDIYGKRTLHSSTTPIDYYNRIKKHKKGGFIIGHSPFKRKLWELTPYEEHDYPNSPFVLGCVKNNAVFIKCNIPTTTYIKHKDSHSMSILIKPEEKKLAVHHKRRFERGIMDYYRRKAL